MKLLAVILIFHVSMTQSFRFPEEDGQVYGGQQSVTFPGPAKVECGISRFYHQRKPRDKDDFSSVNQTSRMLDLDADEELHESARIINGKESKPGAWPWQVSIHLMHPKWGFIGHWCGGILIDSEWVLTAAHCIKNDAFNLPFGQMWTVVVGDHDRTAEEGHEQRLQVDKVILHERFKEYHNDIALLKLTQPAALNDTDYVRPICLPDKLEWESESQTNTESFQGMKCIASGWGQALHGGKLDNTLHQAALPVVETKHCKQMYGMMYNIPINKYHLCAGPLTQGGIGTCVGDSGGPLHCSMKDGKWYLAGITSFGSGCAKPGFPDVFTRVTYFMPWIRGKLRLYAEL